MADQYVLDVWLRVSRMIWVNQDVIAPKNLNARMSQVSNSHTEPLCST